MNGHIGASKVTISLLITTIITIVVVISIIIATTIITIITIIITIIIITTIITTISFEANAWCSVGSLGAIPHGGLLKAERFLRGAVLRKEYMSYSLNS